MSIFLSKIRLLKSIAIISGLILIFSHSCSHSKKSTTSLSDANDSNFASGLASDANSTSSDDTSSSSGGDVGDANSSSSGGDVGDDTSSSSGGDVGDANSSSSGGDVGDANSSSSGGDVSDANSGSGDTSAMGAAQPTTPASGSSGVDAGSSSPATSGSSSYTGATQEYVVQPGDTLSSIAKAQLGDVSKWQVIYGLNSQLYSNPDHIYPFDVIMIPASGAQSAASSSGSSSISVNVVAGDSLWSIAAAHLGKGIYWRHIWSQLSPRPAKPSLIQAGQTISFINLMAIASGGASGASSAPSTGAAVDPNSAAVDPNSAAVDPNSAAVDPNSAAVDPNSAAVDPNSAAVDPNSK